MEHDTGKTIEGQDIVSSEQSAESYSLQGAESHGGEIGEKEVWDCRQLLTLPRRQNSI